MSRSKRKHPVGAFCNAGSMQNWRQCASRRLRRTAKLKIQNCQDWDNLIIPLPNEVDNLYNSPKDGYYGIINKPDDKECIRDEARVGWRFNRKENIWERRYRLVDGHYDKCKCIINQNCWYWKSFRK